VSGGVVGDGSPTGAPEIRRLRDVLGGPFDVELELRFEWWLNHGCEFPCLYGDDGEMSCNCCMTDFKRHPLEELRGFVHERRVLRAQEQARG
jgi:hypothetical protein